MNGFNGLMGKKIENLIQIIDKDRVSFQNNDQNLKVTSHSDTTKYHLKGKYDYSKLRKEIV